MLEVKLAALCLALELIRRQNRVINCSIGLDNVAAILAVSAPREAEADYLVDRFHALYDLTKAKHPRMKLTLRWVPGHKGIRGNELVDRHAKKAAMKRSLDNDTLPARLTLFHHSSSKLRQEHRERIKTLLRLRWEQSPRFPKASKIDPTLPSSSFIKLTINLPRKITSILTQLRTGHVPLQAYLHRVGRADSPTCPLCGEDRETVFHLIHRCSAHTKAREVLRAELGRPAFTLTQLLTNKRALKPLFKYLRKTDRFSDSYGDISANGTAINQGSKILSV